MSKSLPVIAENQMKATYKSLLLASTVVGFEIVELWCDEGEGLTCTYVYVDKDFTSKYPDKVSAPYPTYSKPPAQSPFVSEHHFSIIICGTFLFSYFVEYTSCVIWRKSPPKTDASG